MSTSVQSLRQGHKAIVSFSSIQRWPNLSPTLNLRVLLTITLYLLMMPQICLESEVLPMNLARKKLVLGLKNILSTFSRAHEYFFLFCPLNHEIFLDLFSSFPAELLCPSLTLYTRLVLYPVFFRACSYSLFSLLKMSILGEI